MTWSSTYNAPRWAGVESFLRDLAWGLHLTLTIEVERGWFRERGRFRVTGDEASVTRFMQQLQAAAERYNAD